LINYPNGFSDILVGNGEKAYDAAMNEYSHPEVLAKAKGIGDPMTNEVQDQG